MEAKFESSIRQIEATQRAVYQTLSNLRNLENMRGRLPEDKVNEFEFDNDSVAISVAPVGKIAMRIVEREEPKTVKFESVDSPMPFNFWIQLLPVSDTTCKMKLTLKAELNPFIKGMVQKPLTEGIEKIADVLQMIQYKEETD